MDADSPKSCMNCGAWWRLPLALGVVLLAIVLFREYGGLNTPVKPAANNAAEEPDVSHTASAHDKVSLTIDFGNGRRQDFDAVAWTKGMTVADLLGKASGLEVEQKGSGEGAFLTSINGVANEGAGGSNWLYEVNGQVADRSLAVRELKAGDRVLWRFGPPR